MKMILDTNFLVDSFRFGMDIRSELAGNELFVLDANVRELEKLMVTNSKEAPMANISMKFIEGCKITVLKSNERETDGSLVSYSKEGYVIATNDRILKDRVKEEGGKVAFIRQKKYVVIE